MIQKDFANKVIDVIRKDAEVIGLAAGGSWITGELDEYSDIDLVLVTKTRIGGDKQKMMDYALRIGNFISGFTGEHVGEKRLLVCLYDKPLLHVDIKFVTKEEFHHRVEDPVILFEKRKALSSILLATQSQWPMPDYQWMEDRIWTWVHYIAGKIARGEYFECIDGLTYIRAQVLAPLLHIHNKQLPRGLRKAEIRFKKEEVNALKKTIPTHSKASIIAALENTISLYQSLRKKLFPSSVILQKNGEKKSLKYLKETI